MWMALAMMVKTRLWMGGEVYGMKSHNLLLFNYLGSISIVVGNYRTHPEQTPI